jgi:hypothetical protein
MLCIQIRSTAVLKMDPPGKPTGSAGETNRLVTAKNRLVSPAFSPYNRLFLPAKPTGWSPNQPVGFAGKTGWFRRHYNMIYDYCAMKENKVMNGHVSIIYHRLPAGNEAGTMSGSPA